MAVGYLPEALYEWNELDGAEDVLRRCLLNSMDIALPDMVHCMFVAAARTAAARNEIKRSREILDAAEVAGLRRAWPRLVQAVAWERVRAALQRNDIKKRGRRTQLCSGSKGSRNRRASCPIARKQKLI